MQSHSRCPRTNAQRLRYRVHIQVMQQRKAQHRLIVRRNECQHFYSLLVILQRLFRSHTGMLGYLVEYIVFPGMLKMGRNIAYGYFMLKAFRRFDFSALDNIRGNR